MAGVIDLPLRKSMIFVHERTDKNELVARPERLASAAEPRPFPPQVPGCAADSVPSEPEQWEACLMNLESLHDYSRLCLEEWCCHWPPEGLGWQTMG